MNRVVAFDFESFRFRPGLMAPRAVCGTFSERINGEVDSKILLREDALDYLESLLDDPDVCIVGANTAYDTILGMANRERLVPKVFAAHEAGRVRDVQIRQKLVEIAHGRIERNGQLLVERNGEWVRARYDLAALEQLHLGRDRSAQKHGDDVWRTRYSELDGLPLDQWPKEAVDYALEDAIGTLLVFEAQGGLDGDMATEVIQVNAALALNLMTAWGIRTHRPTVEELEKELMAEQARVHRRLKQVAFLVKEPMTAAQVRDNPEKVAGEVEVVKVKPLTQAQQKSLAKGTIPEGVEVLDEALVAIAEACDQKGFVPDTYAQVVRKTVPYRWKMDQGRVRKYTERVYARKGLDAPKTDGGDTATNKDTLYQSKSRLLALVADGGGVDKLIGTYLPVLKRGLEVPINASFEVLVNSGRTSARGWTDEDGQKYGFNIQNLPAGRRKGQEKVRESFTPRPGYLYSFSDYATLELCALAQVCLHLFGQSRMAEAINEGKDLHSLMAAEMLGQSYEETVKNAKTKGSPEKKARDASKAANFGLPGGLGIATFVEFARATYGVVLTEKQAWELKNTWKVTWPEMAVYLDFISNLVGSGDATLVHPITGFVRGLVGYCDGANHMFQHLAAVGAKIALFRVAYESYVDKGTALFGCRPIAFIHDEIGLEVPAWKGHTASMRLNEVMEESMREVIPDVRIKAVPTLMAAWIKEAEDLYCAEGHLVEWTREVAGQIKKAKEAGEKFVLPCRCPREQFNLYRKDKVAA